MFFFFSKPRLGERDHGVDVHPGAAAANQVVGAEEVVPRAHRRAEHGQLLPPEPVQRGRRVRAGRGAADGDAAGGRDRSERTGPGRLADRLDDDVDARRRSPPSPS